jgi:hypothetical protein
LFFSDYPSVNTKREISIELIVVFGRAMAQVVSRRPLTAAAWDHAQVNPVGFVVDKVALGQVFL